MDLAKDLIFAIKKSNSHGGYGLQKECEALVSHVLSNMVKSKLPVLIADVKSDKNSTTLREEGKEFKTIWLIIPFYFCYLIINETI